jgi:hypothetical protein
MSSKNEDKYWSYGIFTGLKTKLHINLVRDTNANL